MFMSEILKKTKQKNPPIQENNNNNNNQSWKLNIYQSLQNRTVFLMASKFLSASGT